MEPTPQHGGTNVYQTIHDKDPDRKDHIWFRRREGGWKCCLCGAVTHQTTPPDYPTALKWQAEEYEELTEKERSQRPFVMKGSCH
jgi:hypothetical protein